MKLTLRNLLKGPRPAKPEAVQYDFATEALAQAALIDQLMAGPIKAWPQITVFGDDAVTGIDPAPRHEPRPGF